MGSLLFAGLSIADNGRQDEHITLWLDNKALKQNLANLAVVECWVVYSCQG